MGGLSADSGDETNRLLRLVLQGYNNDTITPDLLNTNFTPGPGVVRQNCVFFASLLISLLAAAGAVLAKQWLANYERTGTTGPLNEQGLRRTEKYLGAERWMLRYVVEALPSLILLSLALFFVAVTDYCWSLNLEVAILTAVFSGVGTVSYFLMVIVAAIDPHCPYQTSPSEILAEFSRFVLRPLILICRNIWCLAMFGPVTLGHRLAHPDGSSDDNVFVKLFGFLDKLWTPRRRLWPPRKANMKIQQDSDLLYAVSARSMLEISPHEEVVTTVARNIPAIRDLRSLQQLARGTAVLSISAHLNDLLLRLWNDKTRPDQQLKRILLVARALVHVLLADPTRYASEVLGNLLAFSPEQADDLSTWLPDPELKILWTSIIRLCAQVSVLDVAHGDVQLEWDVVFWEVPLGHLIEEGFSSTGTPPVSIGTIETFLHHFILSEWFLLPHAEIRRLVKKEKVSLDDFLKSFRRVLADNSIESKERLMSLMARALSNSLDYLQESGTGSRPELPRPAERLKLAWDVRFG